MGELTASLAHRGESAITAAVNGASTCVRWLRGTTTRSGRSARGCAGSRSERRRAADIINRIRLDIEKGRNRKGMIEIDEVIREVVVLLRNEAERYSFRSVPTLT